MREHKIDLNITGERNAEGGQRRYIHKSCFEAGNHGIDKFMPLWWWSDGTKAAYKQAEGIRYSDCYEVYGMHRTGCVGCPFNFNIGRELITMKQYEPQLFKACMSVFGTAYELTDRFHCRAKPILAGLDQVTIFDVLEGQMEENQ
jgi:hypothetical protein